jgi:hypothetical protein
LVASATSASDKPEKPKKCGAPCEMNKKQCAEENCPEDVILRLVDLGKMCDPCGDDADCPAPCPKERRLTIALSTVGRLPIPVPLIRWECNTEVSRDAECCPATDKCSMPKNYRVQARLMRLNGKKPEIVCRPEFLVLEGQRAACAAAVANPDAPHCNLQFVVTPSCPESANVEVTCTRIPCLVKPAAQHGIVHFDVTKTKANVKLGKTFKIPLRQASGSAKSWLELEVNAEPGHDPAFVGMRACPVACPAAAECGMDCSRPCAAPGGGAACVAECLPCPRPVAAPAAFAVDMPQHRLMHGIVAGHSGLMALPMPTRPPAPAAGAFVPMQPAAPVCTSSLIRAVTHDGATRLQLQCGDDVSVSFSEMTLNQSGGPSIRVTPCGEQVEISTPHITAVADSARVELGRHLVYLEGDVKLTHTAKGKQNVTCADKACIRFTDGHATLQLELTARADD